MLRSEYINDVSIMRSQFIKAFSSEYWMRGDYLFYHISTGNKMDASSLKSLCDAR